MPSISTFDWDLVYAVRIPTVNKRIGEIEYAPRLFEVDGDCFTVRGSITSWRVVPGGSGKRVRVALSLENGRCESDRGNVFCFTGEAEISIKLTQSIVQVDGKNVSHFAFKHGSTGIIVFENLRLNQKTDIFRRSSIHGAIEEWLAGNEGVIDHVFASVNIVEGLDGQAFSYLQPTEVSYAYCDSDDINQCVLAVLGMVHGRSSSGLDQIVSANAVQDGYDSSIIVSPHLLLDLIREHVIPPALNVCPSDLRFVHEDSRRIELINPVVQGFMRIEGGFVRVTAKKISIHFIETELVIDTEVEYSFEDNLFTFTETHARHGIVMVAAENGGTSFQFSAIASPERRVRHEISPEYQERCEKIALYMSIFFSVTGALIGPGGVIVGGILAGIAYGFFSHLPELVSVDLLEPPTLDLMAFNASAPCAWSNRSTFNPKLIELRDSLRLSGNLHFE